MMQKAAMESPLLLFLCLFAKEYSSRDVVSQSEQIVRLCWAMHKAEHERGTPFHNLAEVEPGKTVVNLGTSTLTEARVVRQATEVVECELRFGNYVIHHRTRHIVAGHTLCCHTLK